MKAIEFTTKVNVSDQDINDILVTAMEGGINYWCRKVWVNGDLAEGQYASDGLKGETTNTLIFVDAEEPEEYSLNKESMYQAIEKYIRNNLECIYKDEIDCGQIDANGADIIVQTALFGEVQFG